ncbi:MAG: NAD(P)-dependent oxidoreductase [Acidobacteria bacterium]|nr:NAD(P)-dependent oxidoreductase [Acidobacteriota bacterium]
MNYRDRRVLVTGTTGFIGRWVARALTRERARLSVTGRDGHALEGVVRDFEIGAEAHVVDLSRRGAFAELYRSVQPEVTFNLAGYGIDRAERNDGLMEAINVRLVAEVIESLAADARRDWPGPRLVHAGSAAEYGSVSGAVTEDTDPEPLDAYGRSKLAATRLITDAVKRRMLCATVVRLFTVYGPGEHPGRLLPGVVAASRSLSPLDLTDGTQQRDFTYVEDVAAGLVRLGISPDAPPVINLATGHLTRVRDFAECAARLLALPPGLLRFGKRPRGPDEVTHGPVDTARLQRVLAWVPPTSIEAGIRQSLAVMRGGVAG